MTISQELDRKQFFQPVVETISLTLRMPACIWLADETGEALWIAAATEELSDDYIRKAVLRLDEPSVASEVVAERKTVVVTDIASDDRWKYKPEAADMGLKSAMVVPLQVKNKIVGVLDVYADEVRDFSDSEKALIEGFATQIAITQRRIRDLAVLNEVSLLINSELRPSDLFKRIVQAAERVLDCQHVSIFLVDKSGDLVLETASSAGIARQRFAQGVGLAGWVAKTKRSELVPDAVKHPQFVPGLSSELIKRSMLLSPMLFKDKAIGVISADMDGLGGFNEHDQMLLEALASQAAVAVRNARLFEQRELLREIARDVTKVRGTEELLEEILRRSLTLLDCEVGSIALLNETTGELEFRYAIGKSVGICLPVDKGLMTAAARERRPVRIGDVTKDKRYVCHVDSTRSELDMPLLARGKAIGVLNFESPYYNAFDEDDEMLAHALADHAAIALYNAQQGERLSTLVKVGQDLTSEIHLERDEILELIYEQARRLTGTQDMYIALYDDESNRIRFGLAMEDGKRVEVGVGGWSPREADLEKRGKTEEIILIKEPILHRTLDESTKWYEEPGHKEFLGRVATSWMGVPMVLGDRVLGVIAIYDWEREYAYDEQDLQVISSMASQAAIALDNADLYHRRLKGLDALNQVGQVLSSSVWLEQTEILELIYEQARRLTGTQDMYIALYDDESNRIRFGLAMEDGKRVEVGVGGWSPREADLEKRGKTEEIILIKEPILHRTLDESTKWYEEPGHKEFLGRVATSWMGVPMVLGDRVLGVIAIYDWEREYAYDEQDLQVISSMANQAAIALNNAALYQQVETVRSVANAITTELDPQACMERILDETMKLLGVHYATIQLVDKATDELVIRAQRGVEGRILAPDLYRIKIGEGITGVAAQGKRTIRVGNVDDVGYYLDYIEGTRSEMATPLIQRGEVIGVLNVEDPRENVFDQDDEDLFELLAEEVVVAIQNAALFEEKDQALRSLREEQRKSRAAERLAAVNTVAAGFVHRMNNVAGTIPVRVGQIKELLDPGDPKYSKIAHFLGAINRDVDGILRTAKTIRSSTEATEPLELVNVALLVSSAIERIALPTGITVCNQCEQDLPDVLVFSGKLIDALENLIRNGIEAIKGSGSVTIACRTSVKEDQEWVAIEIEDTGRGISSEDLPRIFDLFFSTKGGMGFGLWGARTLVESLGGRIDVSSEFGKGTTFTILLPVEKEAQR